MPEWIGQLIYLLPLAALIWKGALMAAEIKELRKDCDANHSKINGLRDNDLQEVKAQFSEVLVRLTRIETLLEKQSNGQ